MGPFQPFCFCFRPNIVRFIVGKDIKAVKKKKIPPKSFGETFLKFSMNAIDFYVLNISCQANFVNNNYQIWYNKCLF